MTIQSYKVLKDLLKCQIEEGSEIHVEYENEQLLCLEREKWKSNVVPFRYSANEMKSILNNLREEGCISSDSDWFYTLTVTHYGNHTRQRRAELIADFLLKSVLVPIAVSVVTALLTTMIVNG